MTPLLWSSASSTGPIAALAAAAWTLAAAAWTLAAAAWIGPITWAMVVLIGVVLGRLLTAGLDRILGQPFGPGEESGSSRLHSPDRWMLQGAALAAAVATWWWEVHQAAMLPADVVPDRAVLAGRWVGHAVLFALLAAASLVDLRHRVIPDLVTVPGVVLGMLWAFLAPWALLPIVVTVPRTFAAALDVPDVLGVAGGLHAVGLPAWLGAGTVSGLAVVLTIWIGWWSVCTAPFLGSGTPATTRLIREPRNVILLGGALLLCAAWWQGGDRWAAVVTAAVGLAVGGGMIWGIRAAASVAMGREAMGMGDVTLMAMIGTWLGWQPCLLVLYCTVFVGLASALVHLVRHGETEFPFGPSLCMATVLVLMFWRPLWEVAGVYLEDPPLVAGLAVFVIVGTAGFLWMLRIVRERRDGRR